MKSRSPFHFKVLCFTLVIAMFISSAAATISEEFYENDEDPDMGNSFDPDLEDAHIEAQLLAEEEKLAAEQAERKRLQREKEFEVELSKMNEEQRKLAQKQKRLDAKVVRKIMKASKRKKHYLVLGLRNFETNIGPLTLFHISTSDVKKAYRKLSKAVHPDKNKDGMAEEAFHALEFSASVLSDEGLRKDYDRNVAILRKTQREERIQMVTDSIEFVYRRVSPVFKIVYRVLKPFWTPILVLGVLII
eukprot:CAMPEP_0195509436 /NCGR_PEP_ID=MMETSP0794_2-20130614/2377_1 /TAXON_ID=515487 /ORGANISM="Stephanopyxis turris, Strain CCMP 815" /LENGTH=246 /DNA_ID=CAMNT_0040636661 /DNA_START=40 /DNA_END=780 /DNA_ORIENTATION=-